MMPELSMHVLDIAENSGKAGASSLVIEIRAKSLDDTLVIRLLDDGPGMAPEKADDPYYTSKEAKRFGLGLPMLVQAAEASGGRLEIGPGPEGGVEVKAVFGLGHLDRMPIGDMGSTVSAIVAGYPDMEVELVLDIDGDEFRFSTRQLREELEGLPMNTPQVLEYIKQEIREAGRRHDV